MQRLLARLERRLGWFALPGSTYYLVGLQALVFLASLAHPTLPELLVLDRAAVLHGQVWRLVTYLFIPPSMSPIWVIFALYWLYLVGTSLEAQWGAFKYQVYWLVGIVLTTVLAFAFNVSATTSTCSWRCSSRSRRCFPTTRFGCSS